MKSHRRLTMTFLQEGTYHVSFSETPGSENYNYYHALPPDFTRAFAEVPASIVFGPNGFPARLRITIRKEGEETAKHWDLD
jgi:hypothetical protein